MKHALMAVAERSGSQDASFDIVHADALKFFPELVADLGCSAEELLRDLKIDPAMLGRPDSALEYRTFVELLARAGTIAPELADTMKRMVGFRNVAVHDYLALQLPITLSVIERHLDDFLHYAQALLQRDAGIQPAS